MQRKTKILILFPFLKQNKATSFIIVNKALCYFDKFYAFVYPIFTSTYHSLRLALRFIKMIFFLKI